MIKNKYSIAIYVATIFSLQQSQVKIENILYASVHYVMYISMNTIVTYNGANIKSSHVFSQQFNTKIQAVEQCQSN